MQSLPKQFPAGSLPPERVVCDIDIDLIQPFRPGILAYLEHAPSLELWI